MKFLVLILVLLVRLILACKMFMTKPLAKQR